MSFKDLFFIFKKNDYEKDLKRKLHSLEKKIEELQKTLSGIHKEKTEEAKIAPNEPPIIIERVNIEKIIFDKYELNNNFGQLGIKELKGKLNIGATYGSDFTKGLDEESQDRNSNLEKVKESKEKGPKINIKPKTES